MPLPHKQIGLLQSKLCRNVCSFNGLKFTNLASIYSRDDRWFWNASTNWISFHFGTFTRKQRLLITWSSCDSWLCRVWRKRITNIKNFTMPDGLQHAKYIEIENERMELLVVRWITIILSHRSSKWDLHLTKARPLILPWPISSLSNFLRGLEWIVYPGKDRFESDWDKAPDSLL